VRDAKEHGLDILDAIAAIQRHPGRDNMAFERDERQFVAQSDLAH